VKTSVTPTSTHWRVAAPAPVLGRSRPRYAVPCHQAQAGVRFLAVHVIPKDIGKLVTSDAGSGGRWLVDNHFVDNAQVMILSWQGRQQSSGQAAKSGRVLGVPVKHQWPSVVDRFMNGG
jgi:hypothetical protein